VCFEAGVCCAVPNVVIRAVSMMYIFFIAILI